MILLKGWLGINSSKDKKKDVCNETFISFEHEFLNGPFIHKRSFRIDYPLYHSKITSTFFYFCQSSLTYDSYRYFHNNWRILIWIHGNVKDHETSIESNYTLSRSGAMMYYFSFNAVPYEFIFTNWLM